MQVKFPLRRKVLFRSDRWIGHFWSAGENVAVKEAREMLFLDALIVGHDDPMLDSGSEFPHVSRPGIETEKVQCPVTQRLESSSIFLRKLTKK
jgi:hypothetical protein